MTSPQQYPNLDMENGSTETTQKELRANAKKIATPNAEATEEFLRQIFTRLKESPNESSEEFTREVGYAFRSFQSSGFSADLGPNRHCIRDEEIQKRITNLQKRSSATLQALENCKEGVSSITFRDTTLNNRSSDIEEMEKANRNLLDELTRISTSYNEEKNKSTFGLPSSVPENKQ